MVKDGDNLRTLAATGVLFWLRLEPEEIYRRIRGQQVVRPLLEVADPLGDPPLTARAGIILRQGRFYHRWERNSRRLADAIIAKMNRWRGR